MPIADQLNADPRGGVQRHPHIVAGHDGSDIQIAMRLETVGIWYNKTFFARWHYPPSQTPEIQPIPWDQFMD
jgi:hypothetical protein